MDQLYSNGTTTNLVALNNNRYLTPASNNKILTTSVAFFELGINFSVSTPVYLTPMGDLCLVGKGDPTITYPFFYIFLFFSIFYFYFLLFFYFIFFLKIVFDFIQNKGFANFSS